MEVRLRLAGQADEGALHELDWLARGGDLERIAVIRESVADRRCLVADSDRIVGYAVTAPGHFFARDFVELIVVHDAYRRRAWHLGVVNRLPSEIVTPRLLLRLWRPDDVTALRGAIDASIEHLRPWLAWTRFEPLSDADRVDLINSGRAAWDQGGDANYGAFRDDVVVGGCGLHHRQGRGTLDLGYWVHVDHVGRGYSVEMARGLTSAAFSIPGVEHVEIHHDKANTRSRAVPRSLGFVEGPEWSDGVHAGGEVGIDCSWRISRSEWSARESPCQASSS